MGKKLSKTSSFNLLKTGIVAQKLCYPFARVKFFMAQKGTALADTCIATGA